MWHRYLLSSSDNMIEAVPLLMLSECLEQCRLNSSCHSINYETGLCVLFTSHADKLPGKAIISQLQIDDYISLHLNHWQWCSDYFVLRKEFVESTSEEIATIIGCISGQSLTQQLQCLLRQSIHQSIKPSLAACYFHFHIIANTVRKKMESNYRWNKNKTSLPSALFRRGDMSWKSNRSAYAISRR